MATQTVENIQRLPPFLEGLQKRLLQTGFGTFDGETQTAPGLLDTPLDLPDFQIAGVDPLTTKAAELGEQMVGSQTPFIEGARDQALAGQQALTSGLGFLQPEAFKQFMNPFQDAIRKEIDRTYDIEQNKAAAGAVGRGAFGGSRAEIARQEIQRNRGDALAKAQAANFAQAVKQAQEAGRLSGGLGQAFGTLAGTTINTIRCFKAKTSTS